MLNQVVPIPNNESERILELSSLDLDYSILEDKFKDLTKLAAKLTGKPIALINLIDSYTQWTVSNHGFPIRSMDRDQSVCQYTVAGDEEFFEVKSLIDDPRFNNFSYVNGPDGLHYYSGVQLKGEDGSPLGALCVLDRDTGELPPDKVEILKIIGDEVVTRLYDLKRTRQLNNNFTEAQEKTKTLARSIREPLAGVIGILQVMIEDAGNTQLNEEALQYIHLIQRSANTMLGLTDAILDTDEEKVLNDSEGNLVWLKRTVEALYQPICKQKGIDLNITLSERTQHIPFFKNHLLQVIGNLISLATVTTNIRTITIELLLQIRADVNVLLINFSQSPGGVNNLLSENRTWGLVEKLVESLDGKIETGILESGESTIEITLPQPTNRL